MKIGLIVLLLLSSHCFGQKRPGEMDVTLGKKYFFSKNYDSALYYYRKAVFTYPTNPSYLEYLSAIFITVGRCDSASYYNNLSGELIRTKNDSFRFALNRLFETDILVNCKMYEEALSITDTGLAYNKNLENFLYYKGWIYLELGKFQESVDYMRIYREVCMNKRKLFDTSSYLKEGIALLHLNKPDEAIK